MSEPPRRLTGWQRFLPIVALLAALFAAEHFYGAQPAELLITNNAMPQRLKLRLLRDGREQAVLIESRSAMASTIVARPKIRRGNYTVEAWPEPPDGRHFEAQFSFDGATPVDVDFTSR